MVTTVAFKELLHVAQSKHFRALGLGYQMTETPLHKAAANNRVECLRCLLEWQGPEKADLEAKNMVF